MNSLESTGAQAIAGIRVLEVGRVPPSELPAMMLADMGATVWKVISPEDVHDLSDQEQRDAIHNYTNRNKQSIALNLKHERGREIFLELLQQADVLIEGFRPGVMQRLRLNYATVAEINPRLVYCSMSSYGQDGPYRTCPAHDLNFMSASGALNAISGTDQGLGIPLNLVADYGGASMHALTGILFGLLARERTGQGQHIDVSYLDTTLALLAATPNLRHLFSRGFVTPTGGGVLAGSYPYYSLYATQDGRMLSVACSEPGLWANFCHVINRPDLASYCRHENHYLRAANATEMHARNQVAAIIASEPLDVWVGRFASADVCVAPVNTVQEALVDSQVVHREMVNSVEHPQVGTVRYISPPVKYSRTPAVIRSAAPLPGEHTVQVLTGLGINQVELQSLQTSGVIGKSS